MISELAALGYKAIDTDDGWCEPLPDERQQWREDAVAALLDTEDADFLAVPITFRQVRARASWITIDPTPPAAAVTSRVPMVSISDARRRNGNTGQFFAANRAIHSRCTGVVEA